MQVGVFVYVCVFLCVNMCLCKLLVHTHTCSQVAHWKNTTAEGEKGS